MSDIVVEHPVSGAQRADGLPILRDVRLHAPSGRLTALADSPS